MIQFKYILDKSSKKFICPKCNKRTFVKYIETETSSYLSDEFGRCDRESNCGYHSNPKGENKNTFEIKYIPPPEPSFHNYSLVTQSGCNFKQNNFIQFLKTIFSDVEVKKAITNYLIGTSKHWNGATTFWQIDNFEKVRHGKIMVFDSITGKRIKSNGKGLINSVRSILKLENFNLCQCLFGLHLINYSTNKTIALVEGEKTAVIMSLFKPEYVWLATGGKSGLKYEFLKPIKDFKIVAFPDKSEYNDWLKVANELNAVGFKIFVNDWLEHQTNFEAGIDLADVYINAVHNKEQTTSAKPQQQIENKKDFTQTETLVYRIEKYKPEIRLLIETFDLTDHYGNEIKKIS